MRRNRVLVRDVFCVHCRTWFRAGMHRFQICWHCLREGHSTGGAEGCGCCERTARSVDRPGEHAQHYVYGGRLT